MVFLSANYLFIKIKKEWRVDRMLVNHMEPVLDIGFDLKEFNHEILLEKKMTVSKVLLSSLPIIIGMSRDLVLASLGSLV